MALLEYRIHANYSAGAGWNWEVATQDRDMIARGVAVTHAQARIDMMSAVVSKPVPVRLDEGRALLAFLRVHYFATESA